MKTNRFPIILITLMLSGCLQSTLHLPPDQSKIEKIAAGTLENSVRIIAGPPDRIVKSKNGYKTYYYREKLTSDCQKRLQTCLPIVIENGKVTAVGRQWASAWKKEHKGTVKTRSKKIENLERRARKIPITRTVDNLTIYRYLLKLDPENPRYQKKVAFYAKRFKKEKNARVARKKQFTTIRKCQNEKLKTFTGGQPVQLAAKILGNGKFYIWLKNTGNTPIRVEADHFFISCKKGKRYKIYSSKDFGRDLKPGAIIEGRLTFNAPCEPSRIVYTQPGVVTLAREIPSPQACPSAVLPTAAPPPSPAE